mgnify:CR=1 FL=1
MKGNGYTNLSSIIKSRRWDVGTFNYQNIDGYLYLRSFIYKDLRTAYNNTNNPETGISIDMVGDALRGLGISLYTNTNLSNDLYYSLFGVQSNGSLLPPTGSEVITNFVTSSIPK